MKEGYIKLYRQFLYWEWYNDINTLRLFLHLLLNASHKTFKASGQNLSAGQLITGRKKLADELKMSEREIRTALEHLKRTGEIDQQTTSQYSIITIKNWNSYQGNDQQMTSKRPLYKNDKKERSINTSLSTKKISQREREILKSHIRKLSPKIQNINAYMRKLIENGDYLDILKAEKAKTKRLQQSKKKEVIPSPEIESPEETLKGFNTFKEFGKKLRGENYDTRETST